MFPVTPGHYRFQTTKEEEEEKRGCTLTFYRNSFDSFLSVHISLARRYRGTHFFCLDFRHQQRRERNGAWSTYEKSLARTLLGLNC